jgi:hypothetical protein
MTEFGSWLVGGAIGMVAGLLVVWLIARSGGNDA